MSLISEVHQAVHGVKGTEEKGLVGDVKEMKAELKAINGRVTTVETKQSERNRPDKKTRAGWIAGGLALATALWKSFTS